jgi:hypothetical protein
MKFRISALKEKSFAPHAAAVIYITFSMACVTQNEIDLPTFARNWAE